MSIHPPTVPPPDIEAIEQRVAATLGARNGWSEAERDRAALLAAHKDLADALREIEWSNDSKWQQDRARRALLRARGPS